MSAPAAPPRHPLPILAPHKRSDLNSSHTNVIKYHASGLSLNWITGWTPEGDNSARNIPRRLMTDEEAVSTLIYHPYFRPHHTPIQLLDQAPDPMLPEVKPHLLHVLQHLDAQGLTNHILISTRRRVEPEDCATLNSFKNLRLTVLVTHSGIDNPKVEPVEWSVAAASLRTLFEHAERYRTVLWWGPIVPGLNDSDAHLTRARELSAHAHATVYTGLTARQKIADYYAAAGLPNPSHDTTRHPPTHKAAERRILDHFRTPENTAAPSGTLFREISCSVAYAHGEADYNGNYGGRGLCRICPAWQITLCRSSWVKPDIGEIAAQARSLGATGPIEVDERTVIVGGLEKEAGYVLQHRLGFPVRSRDRPQRGRAPISSIEDRPGRA